VDKGQCHPELRAPAAEPTATLINLVEEARALDGSLHEEARALVAYGACRPSDVCCRVRNVRCLAVHASWNARHVLRRARLDVFRPILAWCRANHEPCIALLVLCPTFLVFRTMIFVLWTTLHAFWRTIFAFRITFQSTEVATSAINRPVQGW
jgi:hypothetical protein